MGVSIGAASRAVASISPAGLNRPDRRAASGRDAENPGQLVRPEERPEIRVGFGENTLSPSGAALQTLNANLRAARDLVPTVQELQERAREAQVARAEALEVARALAAEAKVEAEVAAELPPPGFVRPEPNPSARFFVQEAEPAAVPRPAQTEPPERAAERVAAGPTTPEIPRTRLDLQA